MNCLGLGATHAGEAPEQSSALLYLRSAMAGNLPTLSEPKKGHDYAAWVAGRPTQETVNRARVTRPAVDLGLEPYEKLPHPTRLAEVHSSLANAQQLAASIGSLQILGGKDCPAYCRRYCLTSLWAVAILPRLLKGLLW